MLTINHNETAAIANKTRYGTDSVLGRTVERLSSGMRINSAKDDAAGQAIANRMTANVNADAVVARGLNDAISYSQTAGGGLDTIANLLIQARTLSVQAANGTLSDADRQSVNAQYQQILAGIDEVADHTEIFGRYPLATDKPDLPPAKLGNVDPINTKFPVSGRNYSFSSGVIPLAYIPAGATSITITIDSLGQDDDLQLFTRDGKHLVGTPLEGSAPDYTWTSKGITDAATAKSRLLTSSNGFDSNAAYDSSSLLEGGSNWALAGSNSGSYNGMNITYSGDGDRYEDATSGDFNNGTITGNRLERITLDTVSEDLIVVVVGNGSFTSNLTWGILPEPKGMPAIPPHKSQPMEVITSADYGQPVQSDSIPATPSDTKTLKLNNTTLLTSGDISVTMKALDSALEKISSYQSLYGAKINRYESNRNVLSQQGVDTATARSRIQDADYAEEASQLARSQIIQQGQTAVSKMANKTPETIIQLLNN
ncbi:flagellin [Pantoea anthophila]|uniref:flagellin N-terminal helical domain-containing protein n=1 Tax=Pantoea anthophila TaxID=470931 RepID=UPI002DBF3A5C|nr:flagellin [Pantoea anthophila]MEB6225182.1 flagellin [Pantoea anthophila]